MIKKRKHVRDNRKKRKFRKETLEKYKLAREQKRELSTKSLDSLWSKKVKDYYGHKCEHCGSQQCLNSHHVFRRSLRVLRWDYRNGVVLCANCHMFSNQFSAHGTPTEFSNWIIQTRGEDWYWNLREKSRTTCNPKVMLEELKNLTSYEHRTTDND